VDSIEFLNFAQKIISITPISEIDYRQIISRSYYCAFHKLNEKSNSLGIPVNAYKGGTHASLRQTLIELRPANKQLKAIAYRLASFHQLRIIADYKLEDKVTEISAKESIENCKKILDQINLVTSL